MTWPCVWGLLLLGQLAFSVDASPGGDGVSPPRIVRRSEPHYTPQARRASIQGTVVVQVSVDDQGRPATATVVSPLGFGLDERAREAVLEWSFQPAAVNGIPIAADLTVEVNFRLFHRWFDPKIEERRTAFNLAVDAIQQHRRTEATLETIKTLARQKYPPAMYLYAQMLESGDGYPRDSELAFQLICEAAELHHAAAMFETGRMALEGRRGVPKDPEKGLELVRNAAVLGHRRAQFYLGTAYESGEQIPRDESRARQYFRLCAASGETPCQLRLARLLIGRSDRRERDLIQAMAWLEIAAEHGDVQSKILLSQQLSGLSEKQISWVGKLKPQLVEKQ